MLAGDDSYHILAMISVASQGNPVQLEWMAGVTMPKRRLVVSSCWFPLLTARELVRHGVDIFKIVVIGLMVEPHPPQTSRDIKRREILCPSTRFYLCFCCTSTRVVDLCRGTYTVSPMSPSGSASPSHLCSFLLLDPLPGGPQKHHRYPSGATWSHKLGFLSIKFKEVSTVHDIVGGIYKKPLERLVVRKASGVPLLYKFHIINYSILFPTNQHSCWELCRPVSKRFIWHLSARNLLRRSPQHHLIQSLPLYHQLHKSLKKAIRAIKPGVQPISAEKTCFENKTWFLIKQFCHSPQKSRTPILKPNEKTWKKKRRPKPGCPSST